VSEATGPLLAPNPAERLLAFSDFLRRNGYRISLHESLTGLRALDACGLPSLADAKTVLKVVMCRGADDWSRFEALFHAFWTVSGGTVETDAVSGKKTTQKRGGARGTLIGLAGESTEREDGPWREGGGAGRNKSIGRTDFRFLTDPRDMRSAMLVAETIARRIRRRRQRRQRAVRRAQRIHIRRTIRRNLAYGGEPFVLIGRKPREKPLRLVVVLDVSHSMTRYNVFLARFVRALALTFRNAEAFAFHVDLNRITELFRITSPEELRRRLERRANLWFGGTRIAASLRELADRHGHKLFRRDTVVLVISDGYDTENAQDLEKVVAGIRSRVRRVIWADPMRGFGGPGGDQEDGGPLAAVLPLLDWWGPADTLQNLEALADYLARA
jgi:uncharacterized protein with von Willebrand factor type A (vWA) domain